MDLYIEKLLSGREAEEGDPDNLEQENALTIFRAAKTGAPVPVFELGCLAFDNGLFQRAFELFEKVAVDESDRLLQLNAIFHIGVLRYDCLIGDNEAENLAEGLDLMKMVAQSPTVAGKASKGSSHVRSFEDIVQSAQYNLGNAYFQGYGVPANYDEAVKFWKLAAKEGAPTGNHQAQHALGQFYGQAHILPNDPLHSTQVNLGESLSWHRQAAKNGNTDSMCALGKMYITGTGVKKDANEGKKYLKDAADKGHMEATAELVPVYFHMKMHGKAIQTAEPVVRAVAAMPDAEITAMLPHQREYLATAIWYYGRCFEKGLGQQVQNLGEAKKQYALAAKLDSKTTAQLQHRAAHGEI